MSIIIYTVLTIYHYFQDIGENAITIPEVVKEVTSKRQIRRLVALPYDLQLKEPDPDSVKLGLFFA